MPIVDNETGQVINLYEAVDVVDLVRSNAYQVLDLTIEDALYRRSKDFPGVVTCTPEDSLASILAYVREKRAHRFVIVEGEDETESAEGGEAKEKKVPGRLVGVLCLSDILKFVAYARSCWARPMANGWFVSQGILSALRACLACGSSALASGARRKAWPSPESWTTKSWTRSTKASLVLASTMSRDDVPALLPQQPSILERSRVLGHLCLTHNDL